MPPLSATVGRFLFGDRVRALVAVCAVFVIAMLAYERGRQSVRVSAAHIADAEYSRGGLAACTACEARRAAHVRRACTPLMHAMCGARRGVCVCSALGSPRARTAGICVRMMFWYRRRWRKRWRSTTRRGGLGGSRVSRTCACRVWGPWAQWRRDS